MSGENMSDKMNLDDFLDNIDFKPLNKGLGFHHEKKSSSFKELSLREKSELLRSDLERTTKSTLTAKPQLNEIQKMKNIYPQSRDMGDLAPFYMDQKSLAINEEISLDREVSNELTDSNLSQRFGAWMLDQALILSSISLIFMFIAVFTKVDLWNVVELIGVPDLVFVCLSFYILFSIFYFSFLDRTNFSTIGKRIMGLKVVD